MRYWILALAALTAFAAEENQWTKVKELKSGTEIRVVKRGVTQPVIGKFDEVQDDKLLLVVKNEQIAIPKDQIDRLDARLQPGGRMKTETKVTETEPDAKPPAGMSHGAPVPGKNYSSGVSFGSKPDFETVYRRTIGAPPKK